MSLAKDIDIDRLTRAYLFANTPRYLYRQFRDDANGQLESIARNTSVSDLVAEYERRTQSLVKSLEDTVVAYAILISLTFLEYADARVAFRALDLHQQDWGAEIRDIFLATARPVSVIEATAGVQEASGLPTRSHSSSTAMAFTCA